MSSSLLFFFFLVGGWLERKKKKPQKGKIVWWIQNFKCRAPHPLVSAVCHNDNDDNRKRIFVFFFFFFSFYRFGIIVSRGLWKKNQAQQSIKTIKIISLYSRRQDTAEIVEDIFV